MHKTFGQLRHPISCYSDDAYLKYFKKFHFKSSTSQEDSAPSYTPLAPPTPFIENVQTEMEFDDAANFIAENTEVSNPMSFSVVMISLQNSLKNASRFKIER